MAILTSYHFLSCAPRSAAGSPSVVLYADTSKSMPSNGIHVLIQAYALHTTQSFFRWCLAKGADVLLTVKGNQRTLHR